ncbi:hypothetical protein T11_4305 [Trichinella zimbabwensis]|uniref:Uncharacterized protein n=1 Tax=Trichinella zimbabwensis TaxID=268475 RepID=A0A0V1GFN4_9BILA|nr:hypothetical protein T11_4305 [Trichinella zimbabwensis]
MEIGTIAGAASYLALNRTMKLSDLFTLYEYTNQ